MSDDELLRLIGELLKQKGHIGLAHVLEIPGVAGDIQARRALDRGVRRGLLAHARGGGFVGGGYS